MFNRQLEGNIKKTREFVEIWEKFHKLFRSALSGNVVDSAEEENFLSTKTFVNSKFDDLMDSLGIKPIKRFIRGEPIYSILSIENLSAVSDEKLNTVDKDWNNSIDFLKMLLERLERKKKRLGNLKRFSFVLRKRRGVAR